MSKLRLREPAQAQTNGQLPADPISLTPIPVAGVLVRKTDLIVALRVYLPTLGDLLATEDGEHFVLVLTEGGQGADPAAQ